MPEFDLSELVAAAARLQRQWEADEIPFCFIGGLAVSVWGQSRQTNDVDATVWTEFGNERPMIDRLLGGLKGRIEDADKFALVNRVLLTQESQGVDVDISLAAFPFERNLIQRAQLEPLRDEKLRVCGASDLIILKAFANRPHDWDDIRGIVVRSGTMLDWELIESELTVLANLKEEPEIIERILSFKDS
ncbi:MAG: DUF6036 family nucleotidyltransferase [Pirellulaceae bacterium]